MSANIPRAKPVFIRAQSFSTGHIPPIDICRAAESTSGINSIFGVQKVSGTYRLYPSSEASRTLLLARGFTFRGQRVVPLPVSPSRTFVFEGEVIPASRLIVSNLPLSICGEDILSELVSSGYKF